MSKERELTDYLDDIIKHPDIPWNKMDGMRDVLIYDHIGVDLMTVWKVTQERLPELKVLFEKLDLTKEV